MISNISLNSPMDCGSLKCVLVLLGTRKGELKKNTFQQITFEKRTH